MRRYKQTDSNVNNEFTHVDQRLTILENTVEPPIGFILLSARVISPQNWLLCNGQEYDRKTYPELFQVIDRRGGTPSNENNFVVPNLTAVSGFNYYIRAK